MLIDRRISTIAHIPDGVVSVPVLITGAFVTTSVVAYACRRMDGNQLPQAALYSSVFFAVSLFSLPVGPSSVHLTLSGLMGMVLGRTAAPAILMALLLQSAFFGYGGLIALGVNTMNLAVPTLICAMIFGPIVRRTESTRGILAVGAIAGGMAVILTGLLVSIVLAASGREFIPAAKVLLATFLPLIVIEGAVTASALAFLKKVSPRLLEPEGQTHADA